MYVGSEPSAPNLRCATRCATEQALQRKIDLPFEPHHTDSKAVHLVSATFPSVMSLTTLVTVNRCNSCSSGDVIPASTPIPKEPTCKYQKEKRRVALSLSIETSQD